MPVGAVIASVGAVLWVVGISLGWFAPLVVLGRGERVLRTALTAGLLGILAGLVLIAV